MCFEFYEVFKNTCFTEHPQATASARWRLSLEKLHIVGFTRFFKGYFVANEFISNNKKHLRSPGISISCFQLFTVI